MLSANSISNSSEKSNTENEEISSSHQSLQTTDAEYMDAVERGDMETAQRMVNEAAKAAGYTAKVFHGTENGKGFTVFNTPAYTTSSRDVAKTYSAEGTEDIYGLFVNTDGFLEITDSEYNRHINIPKELAGHFFSPQDFKDGVQTDEIVEAAKKEGYKGVIFRHIYDNGFNNWQWVKTGKMFLDREEEVAVTPGTSDVYAVFDSERLKSADPVTYDDNGNVIPLSERFNPEKTDIRYSRQTSNMGAAKVDAQVEGSEELETQVGIMRDIAVTAAREISKRKLGANWSREKALPKDKALNAILREALLDKEDKKALKELREWAKDYLWRMYTGETVSPDEALSTLQYMIRDKAYKTGYYEEIDDSARLLKLDF